MGIKTSKLLCCAVLFSSSFLLSSCFDSDSGDGPNALEVQFECSMSDASNCTSGLNGKTAYVGIIRDDSIDCEVYLSQIGSNFFYLYFDASGSTSSVWDGTNMTGNVNFFVSRNNTKTSGVALGDYTACAYIDSNDNGELDTGEPVGQGAYSTNGSNSPIREFLNH